MPVPTKKLTVWGQTCGLKLNTCTSEGDGDDICVIAENFKVFAGLQSTP